MTVPAAVEVGPVGTPYVHALELTSVLKGSQPLQWSFHPNDDGIKPYGNAITGRL